MWGLDGGTEAELYIQNRNGTEPEKQTFLQVWGPYSGPGKDFRSIVNIMPAT